ncbi:MAG: AsmA family protein, partial [Chromatiales bacterium]
MIKWTLRVILVLSLLLGGTVTAILWLEPEFDLTPWREAIAARASQFLGRDLHLDGDITLLLGREVQVDLHALHIANASWAGSNSMLNVAHAAAGLDLFGLFSGILQIKEVVLQDARIVLAVSEDGERNWDFTAPSTTAEEERTPGSWKLVLEEVTLEHVVLRYLDPKRTQPLEVDLDRLVQRNLDGMLKLDGTGRINALEARVEGRVGSLQALLDRRNIDVDLSANVNETAFTLKGQLGDPVHLENIDIESTIKGTNIASLLRALDIEYAARDEDIDLVLKVKDQAQGFAWRTSGHIGSFNLDSQGTIGQPLALDDLKLTLDIHGQDLSVPGQILGIHTLPAQAYRLHCAIQRHSAGLALQDISFVTGDSTLRLSGKLPSFPSIDKGNGQLELAVPDPSRFAGHLGIDLKQLRPLQANVSLTALDKGEERLDAVVNLGENRLTVKGPLGNYPHYRGTNLVFGLSGPDLSTLTDAAGLSGLPDFGYRFTGVLKVADDGELKLQMDQGNVGAMQLMTYGSLGRLPGLESTDLAISLKGRSLHDAASQLTGTALPKQPFDIAARIFGDLTSPRLGDVKAHLGSASLELTGDFGSPPKFQGSDVRFTLEVPKLQQLFPEPAEAPWSHGSYKMQGRLVGNLDLFRLRDARIEGPGIQATLGASLPITDKLVGATLELSATAKDLSDLLPESAYYHAPQTPVRLDVKLARPDDILKFERLVIGWGDTKVTGEGWLMFGGDNPEVRLTLHAEGRRLSDVGVIEGLRLPDERFNMDFELSHTSNKLEVRQLLAKVGAGEFSGNIGIESRERPYIDLVATVRQVDLTSYLSEKTKAREEQPAKQGSAPADRRLIPNQALPLGFLKLADGRLQLKGEALVYPDPVFPSKELVQTLVIDAKLNDGNLQVDTLSVNGARGDLTAKGVIRQAPQQVTTNWSVKARDLRLGLLEVGEALEQLPAHELEMQFTAQGQTYQKLASSLNGDFHLAGGR